MVAKKGERTLKTKKKEMHHERTTGYRIDEKQSFRERMERQLRQSQKSLRRRLPQLLVCSHNVFWRHTPSHGQVVKSIIP